MMYIRNEYETDLHSFEAWSGGKDTLNELTIEQIDQLEVVIMELYSYVIEETELNDFLWNERQYIAEYLGFENFDELMRNNEDK